MERAPVKGLGWISEGGSASDLLDNDVGVGEGDVAVRALITVGPRLEIRQPALRGCPGGPSSWASGFGLLRPHSDAHGNDDNAARNLLDHSVGAGEITYGVSCANGGTKITSLKAAIDGFFHDAQKLRGWNQGWREMMSDKGFAGEWTPAGMRQHFM